MNTDTRPSHEIAGEKLDARIAELQLAVVATFVPHSKSRNKDAKHGPSLNWKVALTVKGRTVIPATDYSAGCAHCPAYRAKQFKIPSDRRAAIRFECEEGKTAKVFYLASQHFAPGAPILPSTRDVLSSFLLDAGALDYASFAEWASEYGYDSDSIKAREAYDYCLTTALALRAALGNDTLEELRQLANEL